MVFNPMRKGEVWFVFHLERTVPIGKCTYLIGIVEINERRDRCTEVQCVENVSGLASRGSVTYKGSSPLLSTRFVEREKWQKVGRYADCK